MIDWVNDLCKDWGYYMRRRLKPYPGKNHVWRLWMEQGADGGDFGPSNPDWNVHRDVLELHQLIRQMPNELKRLMYGFYAVKGAPGDKAKDLGVSITQMYETRARAHYYIVGALDKKDSGISVKSAVV